MTHTGLEQLCPKIRERCAEWRRERDKRAHRKTHHAAIDEQIAKREHEQAVRHRLKVVTSDAEP